LRTKERTKLCKLKSLVSQPQLADIVRLCPSKSTATPHNPARRIIAEIHRFRRNHDAQRARRADHLFGRLQRADDRAHHRRLRAAPDENARPRDIHLDQMRARRRRWNWRFRQAAARRLRFDDDRNKAFRERAFRGSTPRLSTPRLKLLRRRPVPTGHLRDNRAGLQGHLDRSRFLAVRPAPAAVAPARYHLNTAPVAPFGSSVWSSLDTSRSPNREITIPKPASDRKVRPEHRLRFILRDRRYLD